MQVACARTYVGTYACTHINPQKAVGRKRHGKLKPTTWRSRISPAMPTFAWCPTSLPPPLPPARWTVDPPPPGRSSELPRGPIGHGVKPPTHDWRDDPLEQTNGTCGKKWDHNQNAVACTHVHTYVCGPHTRAYVRTYAHTYVRTYVHAHTHVRCSQGL